MGVPHRHVDKRGLGAVEVERQHLVGPYAPDVDAGLSPDHRKPFGLAGMEMIAAGDARHRGRKAYLSAAVQLHRLDKRAAIVGIQFQVEREEGGMVDIAEEGIEQVPFERVIEGGDDALVEVVVLKSLELLQEGRYLDLRGMRHEVNLVRTRMTLIRQIFTDFFICVYLFDQCHLCSNDFFDDHLHQFPDIDQLDFAIDLDLWRLVMRQLMTEGGHHRIVIRVPKWPEYIGDDQSGKMGIVTFGPVLQQLPALLL